MVHLDLLMLIPPMLISPTLGSPTHFVKSLFLPTLHVRVCLCVCVCVLVFVYFCLGMGVCFDSSNRNDFVLQNTVQMFTLPETYSENANQLHE